MFIFLWKNFFLAAHSLKSSCGELFIFWSLIITLAEINCQPKTIKSAATDNSDILCYTPKYDKFINDLMEGVRTDIGMPSNKLYSFANGDDMIKFIKTQRANRTFAVTFFKYAGSKNITGTNLTYIINVSHQSSIPRVFVFDKKYEGSDDDYVRSGAQNLKQVIDSRFKKLTDTRDSSMFYVRAEALRKHRQKEPCDTKQNQITTFGLIFLIIIKKFLISLVLSPLVQEKENGIKDFMGLTSLYGVLDDLAFFLIIFLFTFAYIALNILCTAVFSPLGEISYLHVYMVFAIYLLSDMAFTFMVSTFFDTVFYAKLGGIIFHYVPLVLFSVKESVLHKYSFMIGGNLFYQAIEIFHKFSIKERNLGSDIREGELLQSIYSSLVLQSIAYMFLYFYLYAVIPGKGRKRQPFYFIIQPSFYFGKKVPKTECSDENLSNKQGIRVINLKKTFGEGCRNQKVVVDDINITIEPNCITTLIGPNDSGKTTLINMIPGYVSQTAGEIIVEGNNNPNKYRKIIGFSPERNILLPYLTCKRHLIFFGCLQGNDFKNAGKNAEHTLKCLKLFDKSSLFVEKLTLAMKRKLSLGIALIGCTKIIILDKPTSGLDIVSKKEIWNLLLELRYSKTILIATNDMEEAEMLSDNIIVMSNGTILQTASALEFKYQYGCDYILKLIIEKGCNIQNILNLIHAFIPKAKVNNHADASLYIRLPYSYKSVYPVILSKLQETAHSLKISTISITNNFFDDAFIHATKEYDEEPEIIMDHNFLPNKREYNTIVDVPTSQESITKTRSLREIKAIFYKKLVYIRREPFFSLFLCLSPLVSIALAFAAINFYESNGLQPVCNINGSKIYIKPSGKFRNSNLKDIIIEDIRKNDGIPVLISKHHVIENILKNAKYDRTTYFGKKKIVVVEFDDDGNGDFIRVVHIGNPETCQIKLIVKMINDAISKTQEPGAKTIQVVLVDFSASSIVTPRILKYYSSIVSVGWVFYILFYVSLPYKEAITSFKLMQNISPLRYWQAFTLADICLHTIICVFTFLGQKMFDTIYSNSEQTTFMLSFMFYGFGYFPILYILAGILKDFSNIMSCLITAMILSTILNIIPYIGLNMVPDMVLQHQLHLINDNYFFHPRNETIINMHAHNITEKYKSLIWLYGSMAVALFGFSAILIFFWERRFVFGTCCSDSEEPAITNDNVLAEKTRVDDLIKENKQKEYPLIVNALVKPFKIKDKDTLPAQSLSFSVKPGECFGIVGLNDSGKTQTMQQITGNLKIKSGKVYIYLDELHKNLNKFKKSTGYMMQVNALNDFMTPNEILKYIGLLRGLSDNEIQRVIMDWMEKLEFTKFRNTPIKACSNATKRKLCMSIAMIGKPAVIFLDDPTNGVDPKSRILLWKCIKQVQKENKAVILSTNNLDECDYLCSRVALFTWGYIYDIGNIRQLKSNLEYGCILTIKLRNEHLGAEINGLVVKISQVFAGYIIYRPPLIRYFVNEQPLLWSSIFARMQILSEEHKNVIEDSYVKDVTIEGLLINIPTINIIPRVDGELPNDTGNWLNIVQNRVLQNRIIQRRVV